MRKVKTRRSLHCSLKNKLVKSSGCSPFAVISVGQKSGGLSWPGSEIPMTLLKKLVSTKKATQLLLGRMQTYWILHFSHYRLERKRTLSPPIHTLVSGTYCWLECIRIQWRWSGTFLEGQTWNVSINRVQSGWQFWTLDANSPVFPGRFPVQVLTRSPSPGPDELPRMAWPTRVAFIGISIGWKSAFRGFFLHVWALSSISYMAAWCMSCGVRMRISFAVTYNMIQSKEDGYFSNFCLLKMEITIKT